MASVTRRLFRTKVHAANPRTQFSPFSSIEVGEVQIVETSAEAQQKYASSDHNEPDLEDAEKTEILDNFAKSRLTNFLNRHVVKTSRSLKFDTKEVQHPKLMTSKLYVARCFFQLKVEWEVEALMVTAEGYGPNVFDAEVAASMHAERIIDSCGVQLFSLAASQIRHADAALAAGRLAPYPPNHPNYEAMKTQIRNARFRPSPVWYHPRIASVAKKQSDRLNQQRHVGSRLPVVPSSKGVDWRVYIPNYVMPGTDRKLDESEGGRFALVHLGPPPYSSHETCLCNPHQLCPEALLRLKTYFQTFEEDWDNEKDISIFMPHQNYRSPLLPSYHQVTQRIPGLLSSPARVQTLSSAPPSIVTATGVAREAAVAEVLCAMHAELLIDYYGAPLFPLDVHKQRVHADYAWRAGRFALSPSEADEWSCPSYILSIRSENPPRPLRESVGRRRAGPFARFTPMEDGEKCHNIHQLFVGDRAQHLLEVQPEDALPEFVDAVRAFNRLNGFTADFHVLHLEFMSQWQSSVRLALDERKWGVRGGWAITQRPFDVGELYAARHAVEVLCHLGIPLFPNDQRRQLALEASRRDRGLLVRPRDNRTGQLIAADFGTRSPPAYRGYGCTKVPPTKDQERMIYADLALDFEIVGSSIESDDRNDMRSLIDTYFVRLGIQLNKSSQSATQPAKYPSQLNMNDHSHWVYIGSSIVNGKSVATPVNYTLWFEVLLRVKERYFSVLAMGRGHRRNIAEKMALRHALRIICSFPEDLCSIVDPYTVEKMMRYAHLDTVNTKEYVPATHSAKSFFHIADFTNNNIDNSHPLLVPKACLCENLARKCGVVVRRN